MGEMRGRRLNRDVREKKSRVGCFLLLVFMMVVMIPTVVWADGMPAGGDVPPASNSNGKAPGASGSGTWPPDGTRPKGPFVPGAFVGTWYAFVDNTAFTLTIEQEEQIIKIAHVAVFDYGRRVDSSVGGVSMVGTVSGSLAYVEWKSGLSPENGRATLEYQPGRPATLHWKVVDVPKSGEQTDTAGPAEVSYFLPSSAFLIRK